MPNRLIREGILTSHRVNALNWEQECFYRRLMSVVDDYGRFEAHAALLRAALYPLKLDKIRENTVERLLVSIQEARLVLLYETSGKRYLQLLDFRQQTRSRSKFPPPPGEADATHPPSTCAADAKQMLSTRPADAKHPLSNAHLDVSVSEDGGDIRRRRRSARPRASDDDSGHPSFDEWSAYAHQEYPDWAEDDIRSSWEFYEKGGWLFGRSDKPIRSWRSCAKKCYATWLRGTKKRVNRGRADFDPGDLDAHTGGMPEARPAATGGGA